MYFPLNMCDMLWFENMLLLYFDVALLPLIHVRIFYIKTVFLTNNKYSIQILKSLLHAFIFYHNVTYNNILIDNTMFNLQ